MVFRVGQINNISTFDKVYVKQVVFFVLGRNFIDFCYRRTTTIGAGIIPAVCAIKRKTGGIDSGNGVFCELVPGIFKPRNSGCGNTVHIVQSHDIAIGITVGSRGDNLHWVRAVKHNTCGV